MFRFSGVGANSWGGGGVDGTPPWRFWYGAVFWNSFTFSGKPLIFLTRWGIFKGWWLCWRPVTSPTMVGILEFSKIRNKVKTVRNGNFLCFTWKITHKQALCMILATRFTFIVERNWKNMYFHPKLPCPPATYVVISRNDSNWPSLNLSQNVGEGWTNSYRKRQALILYPLRKNSEKSYRGGIPPPSEG